MCKITVIIPVYNAERYIKKCLNSVLNQSLKDIEIIVINDGSSDGTYEILEKFASSDDKRLHIFHQENKGIGATRKRGFEMASGEYVQFVDADDWIEEDALQKLYDYARCYNADVIESNGFYKHNQYGKLIKRCNIQRISENDCKSLSGMEVAKGIVQRLHSCSLWTKLFRKEFCTVNKIDFIEGVNFGEDAHFICKVCYHNPIYIYVGKTFYHVTDNPTSTTKSRYTTNNFRCRIWWINDLYDYIENAEFRTALKSMKFFIKEESALSGLYNQYQYVNEIFPEINHDLSSIKIEPIRKFIVKSSIELNNQNIIKIQNNKFLRLALRVLSFGYKKIVLRR